MSRADAVSMLTERPREIKRLIDYMLDRWLYREADASKTGFSDVAKCQNAKRLAEPPNTVDQKEQSLPAIIQQVFRERG